MIPMPLWSLPTMALVALLMCGGAWWLGDNHGTFVERAAQTEHQLANANKTIDTMSKENKAADTAGVNQDTTVNRINVDTSAIGKALQNALAKLPVSSDPFMPVWWVRNHDRAASRSVGADPYPGKSDDDASDVRMSEAATMLKTDYGRCELNRNQLANLIAYIRDANSKREKIEPQSFLERFGL